MIDKLPADVLREHVVPRLPPASAARFRASCRHARAAVSEVPRATDLAMAVKHAMVALPLARLAFVSISASGYLVTAFASCTHAAIHSKDGTVEVHRWNDAWVVVRQHTYRMPADIRQGILEAADVARVHDVFVTAPGRRWTSYTPRLVDRLAPD